MKGNIFSAAVCISYLLTASAYASDTKAASIPLSGNITLMSDRISKGISKTDGAPALQAVVKYTHNINENSKLYTGFDVSNVTLRDKKKTLETNPLAGILYTSGSWSFDAGVIYHWFPGADNALEMNYTELKAQAGYDFKVASLTALVKYSPSGSGDVGATYYPNVAFKIPLPHNFSIGASAGRQFVEDNAAFRKPDYFDWTSTFSYKQNPEWEYAVTYSDTDISKTNCPKLCDARVVFSVTKKF